MISRDVLLGDPDRTFVRISPDGSRLAFLGPDNGVLNIWVGPLDAPDQAKPVTNERHRALRFFAWGYTNRHLIYLQDKDGTEEFHLHTVDLETGEIRNLTAIPNVRIQLFRMSEQHPEEVLIGINDRGEHQLHDVYRLNIVTGERTLVQENPGFQTFLVDHDLRVRCGVAYRPEGGMVFQIPDDGGRWKPLLEVGPEDAMTSSAVGFDKSGKHIYLLDSRGRDKAALTQLNAATGETRVLFEAERADFDSVMSHPTEKHIQAVRRNYLRGEWLVLDETIAADLEYLRTVSKGDLEIVSRTLDDHTWIVTYIVDDGPMFYYRYDRVKQATHYLFSDRPALEGLPLVSMHPEVIIARDGLELVSYVSLPADSAPKGRNRPAKPLPTVLYVHGGPWSRDAWGFDPRHQWLANRGYAVLAVNFRGSTGFGKAFVNAGNLEWAAAMHDDLIDAVEWAVSEGIAQRDKIAIMGGSYGGYAALVGLTFTPEVFACGVDIVGPSNLVTLLQNPPPYWMPVMPLLTSRMGDPQTDKGRRFLTSRSPLTFADRIKRPLLIGQGEHDPRVKRAEADQIVNAMNEKGIPVTYMLFGDEGHGFARPENRMAFYGVAEAFLAEHLGGTHEPIGDTFVGADLSVLSGREGVPGLAAALEPAAQ